LKVAILVFFNVVTYQRRPILTTALGRRCLREAIVTIRTRRPFEIPAFVLLPDHLQAIWALPRGDAAYSVRWRLIKEDFTVRFLDGGGQEVPRSASRRRRKERGIWQRRFWEHTIDDEDDYDHHFDYIHYNTVKHRLVRCPRDWPYSSFHRWVDRDVYDPDWGCASHGPPCFDDLDETLME
jgi:putative transposase